MNIFHLLYNAVLQALCAMCIRALKRISHYDYYVGDKCSPLRSTYHIVYNHNLLCVRT